MSNLARPMLAGLCALLGLGVPSADARIEISPPPRVTLLNVVSVVGTDVNEFAAAARAVAPGAKADRITEPGRIVGVFPAGNLTRPPPPPNASGFMVAIPTGVDRVSAPQLDTPGLGWLEPWDVNSSGILVGQARASPSIATPYAFISNTISNTNPRPYLPYSPLVFDLTTTAWKASAATAISVRVKKDAAGRETGKDIDVAGWAQATGGTERAFYWTRKQDSTGVTDSRLNFIPITRATSSRAESITDGRLVAGYYNHENGERRGFVFDINSGKVTDFGPVVVPPARTWFDEFRNVSINADGIVAATRVIGSGTAALNQAFVWYGGDNYTPILPTAGFRDSFAAGISDTGWVVGMLGNGLPQRGFLWYGGHTFELTAEALGGNWVSIDAVYDVYSELTSDPLVQTGILVGMGTYQDPVRGLQQRAFSMQVTLQVPEPHIYVMLGVGLLAIGALRIRRMPH